MKAEEPFYLDWGWCVGHILISRCALSGVLPNKVALTSWHTGEQEIALCHKQCFVFRVKKQKNTDLQQPVESGLLLLLLQLDQKHSSLLEKGVTWSLNKRKFDKELLVPREKNWSCNYSLLIQHTVSGSSFSFLFLWSRNNNERLSSCLTALGGRRTNSHLQPRRALPSHVDVLELTQLC